MLRAFLNTPAKEYQLQKVSNGSVPKAAIILIVSHTFYLGVLLFIWLISHGFIFGIDNNDGSARYLLAAAILFSYIMLVPASLSYFGFDTRKKLFSRSQEKALKILRTVLQVILVTVGLYLLLTVAS